MNNQHTETFQQQATGPMTYPAKGTFNRFLFKIPLIWWRMGMGSVLGPGRLAYPMLVLTTWGRKSRLPRHTMLSYGCADGVIYVGAGWGQGSDWVRNIQADPHVTVQFGHVRQEPPHGPTLSALAQRVTDLEEFSTMARHLFETGGDTHFRPWLESLGIEYDLQDFIDKRQRVYQFALVPTDEAGPPPLEEDLQWVWGVIGASFIAGWLAGRLSRR